jgi:hypothetical protein
MKERFEKAQTFQQFIAEETRDSNLPWQDSYQRARVPGEFLERASDLERSWHLLVLCEEWCGDGVNILPYLARLTEATPKFQLRVLSRDENLDIMDAHLTGGSRSIPIVLILDEEFHEVGWWGPRPGALQDLFLKEIKELPKEEWYPKLRAWYARDRGRTALQEIMDRIPMPV